MKTTKDIPISEQTKRILELLIHEIQECKSRKDIDELLGTWIKGNDLHPENVLEFQSTEEFNRWLESMKAPFRAR